MQRLGRTAASIIQLQRYLTAGSLQQAGGAQCEAWSRPGAQLAAVQQMPAICHQQLQQMHTPACTCPHQPESGSSSNRSSMPSSWASSSSSSSSRQNAWQQGRNVLHSHWHSNSLQTFSILNSGSSNSSFVNSNARLYSTFSSPVQQAAQPEFAVTDGAAESDQDQGPQLSPAAQPKVIEGVCRRKNVKCGWKKIDFVLRMIRCATVDDALAQLGANPKRAAMFVKHAVANARNNAIVAGGDPLKLFVAEAYVTKGAYEKRTHFMSKGYASIKETRKSHLNVRVQQMDDEAAAAVTLRRRPKLIAPIMQRMQDRQRGSRRLMVKGLRSSSSGRPQLAQA